MSTTLIDSFSSEVGALEASARYYEYEEFQTLVEALIENLKHLEVERGYEAGLIEPMYRLYEVLRHEGGSRGKLTQVELLVDVVRFHQGVIFNCCGHNLQFPDADGGASTPTWLGAASDVQLKLIALAISYINDIRKLSVLDHVLDVEHFYAIGIEAKRAQLMASLLATDVTGASDLTELLNDEFFLTHAYRSPAPYIANSTLDEIALAFRIAGHPLAPTVSHALEAREVFRRG